RPRTDVDSTRRTGACSTSAPGASGRRHLAVSFAAWAEANTDAYAGRMTRRAPRPPVSGLLVSGGLLGGCGARAPAIDPGAWQAPLGREHPLTGRIWDVNAARFVTPEA